MPWPLSQDYNEAIQSPASNFADADLKSGEAVSNALGLPVPYSGNFADVYQVRCPDGSRWAVKCFTRKVEGLRERYAEISKHLKQAKLPFTVEFSYLEQGIRVGGQWYPVLKMQWVEGLTLNAFVEQYADKPAMLEALRRMWGRMETYLVGAKVAHADLQHGNVLLVPGATANALALKLIDYDGMWVPALASSLSGEVGHPAYQHPKRRPDKVYGLEVDRFPLLVIATSLRALEVKGKDLWEKYNNGDNLLFKETDLKAPAESPLFAELLGLGDPLAVKLTKYLLASLKGDLASVPRLEEAMPTPAPVKEKPLVSGRKKKSEWEEATGEPEAVISRPARTPSKGAGVPPLVLIGGGIAAALLAVGVAIGAFVVLRGRGAGTPSAGPAFVENHPDPSSRMVGTVVGEKSPSTGKAGAEPAVPPAQPLDADPEGPIGEMRRFEGHTAGIRRLVVSPDGKRLLTASNDNTARLWDAASGRELCQLRGSGGEWVYGAAFLPDGQRALTCGVDKRVHLWDLKRVSLIRSFSGHAEGVWSVAVSPDGRKAASCGSESTVFLWDIDSGKELFRLKESTGGVEIVTFSSDGRLLLTGSMKGPIRLWNVETGTEVRTFKGHDSSVLGLAFTSDGKFVLSGGDDKSIRVWRVEDGEEVRRFPDVPTKVLSVDLSPDGRSVLTASDDGAVLWWDFETGKELHRFQGHKGLIWCAEFSPDGRYAYSAGSDQIVRMWRLPKQAPVAVADPDPDGPPGEIRRFTGHTKAIWGVAYSPDGSRIASCSDDITCRIWDPNSGQVVRVIEGQNFWSAVFSSDTRQLLSLGTDKTLRLWDTGNGKELKRFEGHTEVVDAAVFSSDKAPIFSASRDGTCREWDPQTSKEIGRYGDNSWGHYAVAVSRKGDRLLLSGSDFSVCLYDVKTRQELKRMSGHTADIYALAFAPDGESALSAGGDNTIRIWDLANGQQKQIFDKHTDHVLSAVFLPDGRRVLSGSHDKTLRVWDVGTGQELCRLEGHRDGIRSVALSPDGQYAISGSLDGTARLWRLPPPANVQSAPAVKKPAVPDEAALTAAEKEIKEVYKAEYAKKLPPDKQALARRLLKEGIDTKDKPAARYVLFKEARDIAATIGDLPLSLQVAEEMAKYFAVSAVEMKASGLEVAARSTSNAIRIYVATIALAVADEAEELEEFDVAERLAKVAQASTEKLVTSPVVVASQARLKEVIALRKAYEPVADAVQVLVERPSDPDANSTVGKFHALARGDWDRGLPLLTRGSDPRLKALAVADLAAPTEAKGALELADEYETRAESETGAAKTNLLCRACWWYEQALGKLSGLDRTRIEKNVAAIDKKLPPLRPVVLSARCGAYNRWVDVTEKVRGFLVATGQKFTFKTDTPDLGIGDPAPGEHKSVVVVYRYRGGIHLSIAGEAQTASVPAAFGTLPPAPGKPEPAKKLLILYARYGNEVTYADVTAKVQAAVKGGRMVGSPNVLGLPDAFPSRHKALIIVYREAGKVRLSTTPQEAEVSLGGDSQKP